MAQKSDPQRQPHEEPLQPYNPTRRGFLSVLGLAWLAFTGATLGTIGAMVRFLFPNVLYEPNPVFRAGYPSDYALDVVDERFKQSQGTWLVRDKDGFYALSTVCTHLGCTPNWLPSELKFKCPCHGSGFVMTGVNVEGPAPRPLERYKITLGDDGQIVVDRSQVFRQEKGQWSLPGSRLNYTA
ncbi:MAG: ubiquinol-cytochrome c reductase iron-sulfur subunit [Planctomycetota bacterium]|nr:MAG: ubiquinol-cytochrome c reductase iron-sulfur subunit [Planctomycetota bacterium]